MAAVVVALHIAGWGLLVGVVVPAHYGTATAPIGLGIGITAYTLGMRHAFDVDHITAIDNVTRRLARRDEPTTSSVGFHFALGHSTVVFVLSVGLAIGLGGVLGPLLSGGSWFDRGTSIIGTAVSGIFLVVIGASNARALGAGLVRRSSDTGPQPRSRLPRGPIVRLLSRPLRGISRSRQMYPVGFLFGLGFDTATEIGLLVIAATSVAGGMPWYAVLCLPILFASGMVLFDSLDGMIVSRAYDWALASSSRRLRYNVAVTAVSVVAALGVGLIQLTGAAASALRWRNPISDAVTSLDFGVAGVILALSCVLIALTVVVVRRTTRFERRSMAIESRDPSDHPLS